MGQQCPVCDTYQPQRRVLTVDQRPARKATDVVAVELACGHIMGGEVYTEYDAKRRELLAHAARIKAQVDQDTKGRLAQAWRDLMARKEAEP